MSEFQKYWQDYVASDVVLGSEEYCAQQAWKHQQAKIDELQKRIDGALFEMQQLSLMLSKDIDGYEDPAQICQSEGVDMGVRILEKALRGEHESN